MISTPDASTDTLGYHASGSQLLCKLRLLSPVDVTSFNIRYLGTLWLDSLSKSKCLEIARKALLYVHGMETSWIYGDSRSCGVITSFLFRVDIPECKRATINAEYPVHR